MKRINEIFYSIQGEGRNTGRAAIFIRFSGCNVKCPFCDTEHQTYQEYSDEEIMAQIEGYPANLVVFTGGEPTLQLDEALCELMHRHGYEIAMETNGTRPVPKGVDFVTCSPKFEFADGAMLAIHEADELKVVYDGTNDMKAYDSFDAEYCYLQPCDTGDPVKNRKIYEKTVEYCLAHPWWRVSLQTQKILNVR